MQDRHGHLDGHAVSSPWTRLAILSALPMLGAVAGAAFDQRRHQGFTTWRTACRSAGLNIPTLVDFTLQLLPTAVIGWLLAGLAILLLGAVGRDRCAAACTAAHAGCAVTLPIALVMCALLPPAVMLAVDGVLTLAVAMLLFAWLRTRSRAAGSHP